MSRRVFLHVGAPKTGTTYIQSTLARNRTLLAEHGLAYPETASGSHFEAAIDLTDHPWGGLLEEARGEWDTLTTAALKAPGDVVLSHEVLAPATPKQVRRAQASLAGAELHVVYTARDLGRQIPAEWQETVKHRGRKRFAGFLQAVVEAPRVGSDEWFWRVQGLPDVLSRWSSGLPPAHVHLVTVPPPDAPPDLLWRRFAGVVGLDPDLDVEPGERANQSLGIGEIALLRQLNMALKGRAIPQPVYAEVVRDVIARETLGRRKQPSARATLPPTCREFVDTVTAEWLEWVDGAGIDVVGDLAELQTRWPSDDTAWTSPDRPRPVDVINASVDALAQLVEVEARRYRERPTPRRRRRFGR
ncbi:MAG: hypothetical protein M3Y66_04620 [Actinomycetota bacterium]|nr:hypothetical protein [Actinomycetota bacterium]